MAWSYPHIFTDGTGMVASGQQVDDNFAKVQEKVEALEAINAMRVPGNPTNIGETGFGHAALSSTRPAFVTLRINKVGTGANLAVIKVAGVIVATIGDAETAGAFTVSREASFILPPNVGWTLETPNLAACQPVETTYWLM